MLLVFSEDQNTSCIHKLYVKDPVYYPEYSKMCEVAVPDCLSNYGLKLLQASLNCSSYLNIYITVLQNVCLHRQPF